MLTRPLPLNRRELKQPKKESANHSEKVCTVGNRSIFGHQRDLSQYILQYIASPRQLYNISMVNKLLRDCITQNMIIAASLYTGGYSMKSVINLAGLIKRKAIYVPSPMRLLRLVNGKRCEFCINEPVAPTESKGHLFDYDQHNNARPRYVRASCGYFSCWDCMERWRHPNISKDWEYPCITRKWHKLFYNPTTKKYHHKQFYLQKRHLIHEILSHERVAAYPFGKRLLQRNNAGLYDPTTDPQFGHVTSFDRFEVMSAQYREDPTGEPIGPIFHYNSMRPCVRYMEQTGSMGLDYFLENYLPHSPAIQNYTQFEESFQNHIQPAYKRYYLRKENREVKRQLARYNQIETAVKLMAKVARHMTIENLCENRRIREFYMPQQEDIRAIEKLILSYREAPQLILKDVLSFDTGNFSVDRFLAQHFRIALKDADSFLRSKSRTRKFARFIYTSVMEDLGRDQIMTLPALYRDGRFRSEFQSFRQPFRSRPHTYREWRDTSESRRL
jgi:hypothetical protein